MECASLIFLLAFNLFSLTQNIFVCVQWTVEWIMILSNIKH